MKKVNIFLDKDLVVDFVSLNLNIPGGMIKELEDDIEDLKLVVVNVSNQGNLVEVFGFSDPVKAEECFKNIAFHKFSNWEDYTNEDISSILDNGYEYNGDGSLNITWL